MSKPKLDIDTTRERLIALGLASGAEQLESLLTAAVKQEIAPHVFLDQILGAEHEGREARRVKTALRLSSLPTGLTLADFDFAFQPAIERSRIDTLATGAFIRAHETVLIQGPPGVGKTHLAIALGREAIREGYSVLFASAPALLAGLVKAHGEGCLDERLAFYAKPKLLIIDELGYLPFDPNAAHLFFQLVSRRYERGSLLITSNRSVGEWGTVFGDPVVATAILDRLLHHSHVVTIRGDSYRLREKRRAGLVKAATLDEQAAR